MASRPFPPGPVSATRPAVLAVNPVLPVLDIEKERHEHWPVRSVRSMGAGHLSCSHSSPSSVLRAGGYGSLPRALPTGLPNARHTGTHASTQRAFGRWGRTRRPTHVLPPPRGEGELGELRAGRRAKAVAAAHLTGHHAWPNAQCHPPCTCAVHGLRYHRGPRSCSCSDRLCLLPRPSPSLTQGHTPPLW